MVRKKAIVLLSGGLDSLTVLALAIGKGYEPYALHVNYSQNTQKKEFEAYNNICNYYNINNSNRLVVDIDYLAKIGGTSLINNNANKEKSSIANLPDTYVPFRNGNILSIAASWAEVVGASAIFIGTSEVDFSGYPDCKNIFLSAFERAINLGTSNAVELKIVAPLAKMTKTEIVELGVSLQAPLDLSWSCYFEEDEACGECDSCLLRLNGFKNAGINDPIRYKK